MSRHSLDSDQLQHLEATIFAARNFVVPTEDLRPRTLSMAKRVAFNVSPTALPLR